MARLDLSLETNNLSHEEVGDLVVQSDAYYEFGDVAPMILSALQAMPPDEARATGLTELERNALEAFSVDIQGDEDPESFWRDTTAVAHALHRLASIFGQGGPGAKVLWDASCYLFDPIEETDGGRRVANDDGFWANAPGDWATVCAEELAGYARLVDELHRRGESRVRLLIFI